MLKLWILQTIIYGIIACVLIVKFDRKCDEKNCECGRSILSWIVVYFAVMMGYMISIFRHYIILFTLFSERRKSKVYYRQQALVFNPVLLFIIATGIYSLLKTQKRIFETSQTCQPNSFILFWKYTQYLVLGALLIKALYFFVFFVTSVIWMLRKHCQSANQQEVSSDE